MKEKTRNVVVGNETYQLTKWDPRTAVWVRDVLFLAQLEKLGSLTPPPSNSGEPPKPAEEPTPAQLAQMLWATGGPQLKHAEYSEIQNAALRSASRQQAGQYLPLLHASGSILPQEPIADDAVAVERLVSEAIQFNLSPFFAPAAASTQPQTAR